jgi:hypothetical protein
VILDPLLLGKIKFPGVCLRGKSRGPLWRCMICSEWLNLGGKSCYGTSLRVSLNAQTTYWQNKARSRSGGNPLSIWSLSPSYARNRPRKFKKSLLNSDIGYFINYLNFGKKKIVQEKTVHINILDNVVRTVYHFALYMQSNRYTILLYNRVYSQMSLLYNVSDLMGPPSGASFKLYERIGKW